MCTRKGIPPHYYPGDLYFLLNPLRSRLLVILGAVFLASGCLAAEKGSAEFVAAAPRVAVVSAVDPCINATHLGILLGYNWRMAGPPFDFNQAILKAVRGGVKREIKVMDGHAAGLVIGGLLLPRLKVWEEHYRTKLSELAAAWEVEVIVVIHGTDTADWMGHTGARVEGLGLFEGGRQRESYAVLAMSIFDAREKRFHNAEVTRKGRELPPLQWRKTWDDYTPQEQTLLLQCVSSAVDDSVASLLGRVGLAPAVDEKPSFKALFTGDPGKSWIPEGNEIKIPAGLSPDVANAAVLGAFRDRGWQVSTSNPDRIVGIITHGKKEAIETAIIQGDTVTLTAEQFEVQASGQRVPIRPHDRWHRNLKETIVEQLFKVTPASRPAD